MIFRKSLRRAVPYQIHAVSRRDRIRLDMNENPLLCSRKVTEALKNISSEDVSIYPEYGDFIEKIARFHGLKPENFLLANGADDAIRAVVDACVESGDEAVKLSPTYAMHEIFLRVRNAKIVEVKYKDFVFPAEEILKRISRKTRLVIIVNPDSPTGISAGKKVIIEILKRARRFNAAVLLDETYCHFAGGTYARLVKVFDNLVVVHSFAKVFGLAGLRLGLIISNRANIKELSKTSLPYAAGSAAVIAGSAAIEDREFIARVIRETSVEKNFLFRELKKIVSDVRMTGTNFLIVFFGAMEATIRKRLAEKGILVRGIDQKSFLKGYARISVGSRPGNLALLNALKDIIPPDTVLFDMDGVLVDVSGSYRLAIKKTAEFFLQSAVGFDEIEDFKSRGGFNNDWDLTGALLLSHGVKAPREKIIGKFQELYLGRNFDGFIKNEKWLMDVGILRKLKRDFKTGIVTGRPRVEAEFALKRFGVRRFFDVVVALEDVKGRMKPDPFGLEIAVRRLKSDRALYVGDNIDDVKAAAAAGVFPAAVVPSRKDGGGAAEKSFREAGARFIIRSVNEIREALK